MTPCSIDECPRPAHGRGMCRSHYMKMWRYGNPHEPGRRPGSPKGTRLRPLLPRLEGRWTVDTSGCWLWIGDKRNGYGSVWVNGRRDYAHRAIYTEFVAPIPAGLVVRHSCDTRACVNPTHLLIGTQADNLHDMAERGRWRNQHAAGPNWSAP